jgi:peroxiredoxin
MVVDQSSGGAQAPRKWAQAVAWTALALAVVIVVFIGRERISIDDVLPGRDAAGLPAVGEPAPDFRAVDADGRLVALSDFRGQPVWLNFWGAWCPPCRAEMPELIRANETVEDRGAVLIAVSLDEPSQDAFAYAKRAGMDFVVLSDPEREAIQGNYRVRTFPTHIFIDADGIVREVVLTTMSTGVAISKLDSII